MSPKDSTTKSNPRVVSRLSRAVVRFAGDSGDGMQLTGAQFTSTAAFVGNDIATLPDFPAEIRAPAGTLAGVSGFQIQFASDKIYTPGDRPDVLVAMNPAALKANIADLEPNAVVIVNTDAFKESDLRKAGYSENPLENGSLSGFQLFPVELSRLTRAALKESKMPTRGVDRCKNFFALGLMYYLYNRPLDVTLEWIENKFAGKGDLVLANQTALRAGFAYGEATELFAHTYEITTAPLEPGTYRNISGHQAMALGFVAAADRSGLPLFQGSYPITPASELLHELATFKNFNVTTFQAEDEISAIGATIGAAFAGQLAMCSTSGPGMALKAEFLTLAVMVELPIVVVNVQRAGPSTGMPTKTEQADLLQALYGRFGEAPCIVLAATSPADCFRTAFEASKLALTYMTPVILLSDGFIASGAEPWRLPTNADLPEIPVRFREDRENFLPYDRDEETLARPWAVPGTPGLEHRVGGLEKADHTGDVSYDPVNHERMVHLRQAKIERVARSIPPAEPTGDSDGGLLVVGWGSTYGAITSAVGRARDKGLRVGHLHLRHLNPLPPNLGEVLRRYDRVLVPEINLGQLALLLQGLYLVPVERLNKVQGIPFKTAEILARIEELAEATKQ